MTGKAESKGRGTCTLWITCGVGIVVVENGLEGLEWMKGRRGGVRRGMGGRLNNAL